MRYIKKNETEPACLSEYKAECKTAGVVEPLLYSGFNRTGELKAILCYEQHNVCCYCQRPVKGFRIEHSYPENGPDLVRSMQYQLDYSNLFAACMDSQGKPKDLQYCDVAKGNQIIREFIKEENCQVYFRYLPTGEIIPNGKFTTWKEYEESESLSPDELTARHAIVTLNLNCSTLKYARKMCIEELVRIAPLKTKEQWLQLTQRWLEAETYPSFIELRLQYIYRYINKN